jgi:hypothetical protein
MIPVNTGHKKGQPQPGMTEAIYLTRSEPVLNIQCF